VTNVKKFTHGLQGRLPFPYKKSLHRENTLRDYPIRRVPAEYLRLQGLRYSTQPS